MIQITEKFVEKLNEETTSENFEDIVYKYNLETPEEYSHEELCENDGIEVWGVTSDETQVLVYDNNSGWYLLSISEWVDEIAKYLEDQDYDPEEIKELITDIPALSTYYGARIKKVTTIKVDDEFKDQLKDLKLVQEETYQHVMERIIKEAAKVPELEKDISKLENGILDLSNELGNLTLENEELRKRIKELEDEIERIELQHEVDMTEYDTGDDE